MSTGEKPQVDVVLPADSTALNETYDEAWHLLRSKPPAQTVAGQARASPAARAKDYYANIRSRVLLAWLMSNIGLAVGVCVIASLKVQILYMGILLYSAAGIALIKLVGTIIYLYVQPACQCPQLSAPSSEPAAGHHHLLSCTACHSLHRSHDPY